MVQQVKYSTTARCASDHLNAQGVHRTDMECHVPSGAQLDTEVAACAHAEVMSHLICDEERRAHV